MSEYRFSTVTSPGNGEITIYRGKVYRLPDEWTTDSWSHYWDGMDTVAFYDEGYRGRRVVDGIEPVEDAERAITALDKGGPEALDRLAARLHPEPVGTYSVQDWAPGYFTVPLDRGMDLYVMSWHGDTADWRDEIEAVWNGDIWRIETEEFDGEQWHPADDVCEEYYGEDKAMQGFHKEFPLTEFPAEVLVGSDGS